MNEQSERDRVNALDEQIIALLRERAEVANQIGRARLASGGTRLVLSREQDVIHKYRNALGATGTKLALLVLHMGRGPL